MPKTHPRYENADFPDWEFAEFPMMIYPTAKDPRKPEYHTEGKLTGKLKTPGVEVADEEELERVLAGAKTVKPDDGSAARLEKPQDALEALQTEAANLGVQFDKKWSLARLQDAIDMKKGEAVV